MSYQVANGSIPATVEGFLRTCLLLRVEHSRFHGWTVHGIGFVEAFDWPHDRSPSLQEAIEAVMARE